ncbi:MFS transporter [Ferruginibacter albus]|uniref:MFS transporter n=1 Tax=Ferruginibacter albus TaxID=2875540 RepID=UPI001CC464F9|nr:MFS transporter [Ferruginibacter albus]UAY51458.1 MFS transporter [Ferruginibacter albus]
MKKQSVIFNMAVFVAALGYFVDIYDLLIFTIVRKPSIIGLGVTTIDGIKSASIKIINLQMYGLLIGGIIWGVLADKKGRLSVLFGSIILYSVANLVTGYTQNVDQYAWARFVAGLGLAGELGAGITLVSELLPKEKRGIGTSVVAGVGLSGAVLAYFIFHYTQNWRLCYYIGGGLGFVLLILRISVAESGMFNSVKEQHAVVKGNFLMFFNNSKRFLKYIKAILIGLPTWYCVGILVNYSDGFAKELYGSTSIDSGRSIMFSYIGVSLGGICIGMISQWMQSRKKPLFIFYALTVISAIIFFSPLNNNDTVMYLLCGALGFATGFWAVFVTMGAEQFGTNLRATAATTIPNMVRGSLPLMNLLYKDVLQDSKHFTMSKSAAYTGVLVICISLIAAFFTEETFHKDLNYIEQA